MRFDSGLSYIGILDDVRIYNRALSAAEVTQLYNLGTATHQAVTLNPPNLNPSLVGHWTFDGKDMISNVRDTSGGGKTANLVSFTSTTTAPGVMGQALSFNGTNNYVAEPTSISNIQSVAFWAQTASTTAFGLMNLTGSTVYIATDANNVITGTGFTAPTYYIDGFASTTHHFYRGTWHHIVVTGTAAITGSQLEIGRGNSLYFSGAIDDSRVYNRALTAAEVTSSTTWAGEPRAAVRGLASAASSHRRRLRPARGRCRPHSPPQPPNQPARQGRQASAVAPQPGLTFEVCPTSGRAAGLAMARQLRGLACELPPTPRSDQQ